MRQEKEKEQKERYKPLINKGKNVETNRNNKNNKEYEDVYERLYKKNIILNI